MAGQAKPLPFDCSGMEVPAPMKLGRPMASYYIQSKHEKGATKVHLSSSHKSIMSCHYSPDSFNGLAELDGIKLPYLFILPASLLACIFKASDIKLPEI